MLFAAVGSLMVFSLLSYLALPSVLLYFRMFPSPKLLRNLVLSEQQRAQVNFPRPRALQAAKEKEISARVFLLSPIQPGQLFMVKVIVNNCGYEDLPDFVFRLGMIGYQPKAVEKRGVFVVGEKWSFEVVIHPEKEATRQNPEANFLGWRGTIRKLVIPSATNGCRLELQHFGELNSQGREITIALIGPRAGKSTFVNACYTRFNDDNSHVAVVCEKAGAGLSSRVESYPLPCNMKLLEVPTWSWEYLPQSYDDWVRSLYADAAIFFWDGGDAQTRESMVPCIQTFMAQGKTVFVLTSNSFSSAAIQMREMNRFELSECDLLHFLNLNLEKRQEIEKNFASDLEVEMVLETIRQQTKRSWFRFPTNMLHTLSNAGGQSGFPFNP